MLPLAAAAVGFAGLVWAVATVHPDDWANLGLSAVTAVKIIKTSSDNVILSTHYSPAIVTLPAALALIGLAGIAIAVTKGARANGGAPHDAIAAAGRSLRDELSNVLALLRSHVGSNEAFGRSLAGAQGRLAAVDESKQVRVIVSLLVDENERMRLETEKLKKDLEESQDRIEDLQTTLTKAQELVLEDPLTAVGNRRHFEEILGKEIAGAKSSRTRTSLILCDLDEFKKINDTYGHTVGDDVLKVFASLLKANVRDNDTVARIGGEEFALILPKTLHAHAVQLAERIRKQLETRNLTERRTGKAIGKFTASFGVSQLRDDEDHNSLLERTDAKLYAAKSSGRNKVIG
jgi:diguanylate cyclase